MRHVDRTSRTLRLIVRMWILKTFPDFMSRKLLRLLTLSRAFAFGGDVLLRRTG